MVNVKEIKEKINYILCEENVYDRLEFYTQNMPEAIMNMDILIPLVRVQQAQGKNMDTETYSTFSRYITLLDLWGRRN